MRMHADQREDIDEAEAGDIVAVLGVDCASGDTYASEYPYCTLENMFVPEPVIRMAIAPADRDGADRLSKALHRFRREDPTLQVTTDEETGETLIAGMGELHLDIYVERIRREYNVAVEVGAPQGQLSRGPHASRPSSTPATASKPAARASTPTSSAGSTCCRRMPRRPSSSRRTWSGGRIPKQFIPAVEKGFRSAVAQGPDGRLSGRRPGGLPGRRLVPRSRQLRPGVPDLRRDGDARDVPQDAAGAAGAGDEDRDRMPQPVSGLGGGQPDLPPRHRDGHRGRTAAMARIEGEVPLAETFGYSTDLRSMTQGQGTFTMEFARYKRLPRQLEEELIAERKKTALRV